jgi:hypothetical protein
VAENPVVRFGLVKGLDALFLVDDHPVIAYLGAVVRIPSGVGPLSDIIPLKVRACGKDDVGKSGLGVPPDFLVDHKFELGTLVHPDETIGLGHRSDIRSAITVEHLAFRLSRLRINVRFELLL